jgi:hypothetical protein
VRLFQVASIAVSALIYVATIFLMKKTLHGIQLFSGEYLPATCIIVGTAWAPPFVYEQLKRWMNPTLEQKVMSQQISSIETS